MTARQSEIKFDTTHTDEVVTMDSKHPALSEPGFVLQLPIRLRRAMESLFSQSFENVRVHVGSAPTAIGARAYACGNQIHITPEEYRPDSAEGWRVLGHELAHVVQQRLGQVEVSGDPATIVNDEELEDAANVMGERAAVAFSRTEITAPKTIFPRYEPTKPTFCVQCLMSVEVFRKASKAPGKRNKIASVDAALTSFHAAVSAAVRDPQVALQRLRAVHAACKTYLAERPSSGRATGVITLMRQVAFEETVFAPLAQSATSGDSGAKWKHLSSAKENSIKIFGRPEMAGAGSSSRFVDDAIGAYKVLPAGGEASQAMMTADAQALRAVKGYSSTPIPLKYAIEECLDALKHLNISYGAMNAASVDWHANPIAGAAQYTLNHNADQGNGAKIRLGSMLHELTHIVIGVVFGNSRMLFDVSVGTSEDAVLNISRKRRAFIAKLMDDIESNGEIRYMAELKSELAFKAKYPLGGMSHYLPGFRAAGKIDEGTFQFWHDLGAKGVGLELIEFTPCIHQMALWCYMYDLPVQNPVFQSLLGACAETRTHRAMG